MDAKAAFEELEASIVGPMIERLWVLIAQSGDCNMAIMDETYMKHVKNMWQTPPTAEPFRKNAGTGIGSAPQTGEQEASLAPCKTPTEALENYLRRLTDEMRRLVRDAEEHHGAARKKFAQAAAIKEIADMFEKAIVAVKEIT